MVTLEGITGIKGMCLVKEDVGQNAQGLRGSNFHVLTNRDLKQEDLLLDRMYHLGNFRLKRMIFLRNCIGDSLWLSVCLSLAIASWSRLGLRWLLLSSS